MTIKQQRPLDPAIRLRIMKLRFRVYLVITSLLILFFAWLAANALINDHYRNDPGTQTITGTITNTKKDCTRSGCYYDSYGNYSIYGIQEQGVKLVSLSNLPVTGQTPILVNPKRPRMAMPYYYNPYPGQAITSAIFAGLFVLWNSFLYLVLYRRSKRKLLALIGRTKSAVPFNPISL